MQHEPNHPFELALSAEARTNISNALGPEGYRVWTAALPGVFEQVAQSWHLRPLESLGGGTRGLVLRCEQDGNAVVLKIPFDKEELGREYYALSVWERAQSAAVIRPLAYDAERGALLLPLVRGSRSVDERSTDVNPRAVVSLAAELAAPVPADCELEPLCPDIHARLDKNARRLEVLDDARGFSVDVVTAAHRVVDELRGGVTELVHGDLYPGNVLVDGDKLLVCDPKGFVGDRNYDAATWCVKADGGLRFLEWEQRFVVGGYDAARIRKWARVISAHDGIAYVYGKKKPWSVPVMLHLARGGDPEDIA